MFVLVDVDVMIKSARPVNRKGSQMGIEPKKTSVTEETPPKIIDNINAPAIFANLVSRLHYEHGCLSATFARRLSLSEAVITGHLIMPMPTIVVFKRHLERAIEQAGLPTIR